MFNQQGFSGYSNLLEINYIFCQSQTNSEESQKFK